MKLKAVYTNINGHRVQPFQYDRRAGTLNERVYVHNFTTGYDEAWSTRLFLAEHTLEAGRCKQCIVDGNSARVCQENGGAL